MRFHFPNLTRPKKAARVVAEKLSVPLSSAQRAIARISGYSDWHDLEERHASLPASPLDQQIECSDFFERQAHLSLALSKEIGTAVGDAHYALACCHLIGDRPGDLADQIQVRIRCWRQSILPPADSRSPGSVGKLKTPGRNGEAVILRAYGSSTTVISHRNVTTVADFEYVSPRNPTSMFVPMRLYLPYGYWVESDGAKVLFARDCTPMWRIRSGAEVERLDPWLWINWREEHWYWKEDEQPWTSPKLARRMEKLLTDFGVRTLPIWADSLPLLIHNRDIRSFAGAIESRFWKFAQDDKWSFCLTAGTL